MLHFIDISHWQDGLDPSCTFPNVDAVVCKATGGTSYVDKSCDKFVQAAIKQGKLWGFYHYAHDGGSTADAIKEADFFYKNCLNYFGEGIPILDWEENSCSVEWVNKFVNRIYGLTGVWCWIYANPWRINQGGVESNCGRWIASYPSVAHPTFATAEGWSVPSVNGGACAWQFCSDGRVSGYSGNLDCDLFFGDKVAWKSYALGHKYIEGSSAEGGNSDSNDEGVTLEGQGYRVTIEKT